MVDATGKVGFDEAADVRASQDGPNKVSEKSKPGSKKGEQQNMLNQAKIQAQMAMGTSPGLKRR